MNCEEFVVQELESTRDTLSNVKVENNRLKSELKSVTLELKNLKDVLKDVGTYKVEEDGTKRCSLYINDYSWTSDLILKREVEILSKYFKEEKEEEKKEEEEA